MTEPNHAKTKWPWLIRLCYWPGRDIDLGVLGIWHIQTPIRFAWQRSFAEAEREYRRRYLGV